jgi:epsilon-lactone hydrolase
VALLALSGVAACFAWRVCSTLVQAPPVMPAPSDAAGWWAALAPQEARLAELVVETEHRFTDVKVERVIIGGVPAHPLIPAAMVAGDPRVIMHLHGGGYVTGGGEPGILEALMIAHYASMRVVSVDYRMPPDNPFPAALEDAVSVWRALLRAHDPAGMAIAGSSAGGGLALATVLELRDLGLSLPAAVFAGCPWVDLAMSGETIASNNARDEELHGAAGALAAYGRLYAGARSVTDPLVSPLYADLRGLPPVLIVVGENDILLSDADRIAKKLRQAGARPELEVIPGMSHGAYILNPENSVSVSVWRAIAAFLRRHLHS